MLSDLSIGESSGVGRVIRAGPEDDDGEDQCGRVTQPLDRPNFLSSTLSPHQFYHHGEADRTRRFSGGDFGAARPAGGWDWLDPGGGRSVQKARFQ